MKPILHFVLLILVVMSASFCKAANAEKACEVKTSELSAKKWKQRPTGFEISDEEKFFLTNSKKKNVVTLASGVQYKVLREGCGNTPSLSSIVKVRYHMTLLNGKVIDSSYNENTSPSFPLKDVIPGWADALTRMQPGAIWEIAIPSKLAYGAAGVGPVPGNAPLLFTVELIGFF
jgi:FKBP-type peptidyl-prolyl cis-trans isomerase FklB